VHGSFSVTAAYPFPPARVFSAFCDEESRRKGFRLPGDGGSADHTLDFREGGGEVARSTFAVAGTSEHLEYRSRFLDITAGERIVLSYEFLLDGVRRWVSLVTVELTAVPEGAADGERPDDGPAGGPLVPEDAGPIGELGPDGGTLLKWTEQYTYLVLSAGGADVAHLRGGTRLSLNGLRGALGPVRGGPGGVVVR
jgi:uncharacterized protein YndB with AHSA1/START domain